MANLMAASLSLATDVVDGPILAAGRPGPPPRGPPQIDARPGAPMMVMTRALPLRSMEKPG
jgi:hypothetical protein